MTFDDGTYVTVQRTSKSVKVWEGLAYILAWACVIFVGLGMWKDIKLGNVIGIDNVFTLPQLPGHHDYVVAGILLLIEVPVFIIYKLMFWWYNQ